jgi:hypothetical protein
MGRLPEVGLVCESFGVITAAPFWNQSTWLGPVLQQRTPEDTDAMWPLTAQQVADIYRYGAEAVWHHEAVCRERE